jgi:hypothetical protein
MRQHTIAATIAATIEELSDKPLFTLRIDWFDGQAQPH